MPTLSDIWVAHVSVHVACELIHFMNTRGTGKILFASDHPVLSFERCLREAAELPLREGVLERYLYDNARALFRWS